MTDPWTATTYGSNALSFATHLAWHDHALCREVSTSVFFSEPGEDDVLRKAKQICNGTPRTDPCSVRETCLSWAINTNEKHGVFGGMSPRQRAREATERRRRAGTLGQKQCQICGRFFPGGPNHKNCSTECERESRRRHARRPA